MACTIWATHRHGGRSPIDIVMEWGNATNATSAARYLCVRLGVTPESLGWGDGSKMLHGLLNKHAKNVEEPDDVPILLGQMTEGEQEKFRQKQSMKDAPSIVPSQDRPWPLIKEKQANAKSKKRNNDEITEDLAAARFVEECGKNLRYRHSTGAWFRWEENIWCKDETQVAWVRLLAREMAEHESPDTKGRVGKRSFASGVEAFAQRDPDVAVTVTNWDQDEWLLGTPTGTVDLRTGETRPGRQEDGITKATLVAPANTGCPQWLKFLDETNGR